MSMSAEQREACARRVEQIHIDPLSRSHQTWPALFKAISIQVINIGIRRGLPPDWLKLLQAPTFSGWQPPADSTPLPSVSSLMEAAASLRQPSLIQPPSVPVVSDTSTSPHQSPLIPPIRPLTPAEGVSTSDAQDATPMQEDDLLDSLETLSQLSDTPPVQALPLPPYRWQRDLLLKRLRNLNFYQEEYSTLPSEIPPSNLFDKCGEPLWEGNPNLILEAVKLRRVYSVPEVSSTCAPAPSPSLPVGTLRSAALSAPVPKPSASSMPTTTGSTESSMPSPGFCQVPSPPLLGSLIPPPVSPLHRPLPLRPPQLRRQNAIQMTTQDEVARFFHPRLPRHPSPFHPVTPPNTPTQPTASSLPSESQ